MFEPSSVGPVQHPGWLRGADTIPWRMVHDRLREARHYWIASVRADGFPHTRPVWGVCNDELLMLSPGGGYWTMRNVSARSQISVHLPEPEGLVVVVDGQVSSMQDRARRAAAIAQYNAKYGESYDPDEGGGIVELVPRRAFAWDTRRTSFCGTRYDF